MSRLTSRTILLPDVAAGTHLFVVTAIGRGGAPVALAWPPSATIVHDHSFGRVPIHPNVVHVAFFRPTPTGELQIGARNEPVETVKIVTTDVALDLISIHTGPGDSCPGVMAAPELTATRTDQDLGAELFGPQEYYLEVTAWASTANAAQAFFVDLDTQTSPQLYRFTGISAYEADFRDTAVHEIMLDLRARFEERGAEYRAARRAPALVNKVAAAHMGFLEHLSGLQKQIIEARCHEGGVFSLKAFEDAFEKFANGDLRHQLPSLAWCCQPSSGYFVLFAEFAVLAIENDVHRAFWEQLLPVLTRAQAVFFRVYGRDPVPIDATYADHNACNYSSAKTYDANGLSVLREDFAIKTRNEMEVEAARKAETYMPGLL